MFTAAMVAPIGELAVVVDEAGALLRILLPDSPTGERAPFPLAATPNARRCAGVLEQLREYFAGKRQKFELALAPPGTDFQQRVWRALQRVPFGRTTTFAWVAERIGHPTALRAVGAANAHNPVPIVVPCHRVLGSQGEIPKNARGLTWKRWLLDHEAAVAAAGRSGKRRQPAGK